ncbi:MAG: HD domain-containing protein, partial [Liquorilactobacillus satsumensis]
MAVRNFAKEQLGEDRTGHGFDHIERVVNLTKKILKDETADRLITITAAYLHDISDDKLFADPAAQNELLNKFLADQNFSSSARTQINSIINNLSFSKTLTSNQYPLSPAGKIVQDADRLDAIGAIGITRAIYYGGSHAETIYDPQLAPRKKLTNAEYRDLTNETIINHFYEKLLN